jgi:hypothetical protein
MTEYHDIETNQMKRDYGKEMEELAKNHEKEM